MQVCAATAPAESACTVHMKLFVALWTRYTFTLAYAGQGCPRARPARPTGRPGAVIDATAAWAGIAVVDGAADHGGERSGEDGEAAAERAWGCGHARKSWAVAPLVESEEVRSSSREVPIKML